MKILKTIICIQKKMAVRGLDSRSGNLNKMNECSSLVVFYAREGMF